jgi:hypothetical protein
VKMKMKTSEIILFILCLALMGISIYGLCVFPCHGVGW